MSLSSIGFGMSSTVKKQFKNASLSVFRDMNRASSQKLVCLDTDKSQQEMASTQALKLGSLQLYFQQPVWGNKKIMTMWPTVCSRHWPCVCLDISRPDCENNWIWVAPNQNQISWAKFTQQLVLTPTFKDKTNRANLCFKIPFHKASYS